jgi:four helix bundle protein
MENYKDLKAWQKAMDLVDAVYAASKLLPKTETYRLGSQMRAAASSIASNIAEGKGRRTYRDYRHFLVQARGSAYELETEILIAQRQQFFDTTTATKLIAMIAEACKPISGLIAYLDRRIGDFDPPST